MSDTEITDIDVVAAMLGHASAALREHTLTVVDAENVAEGSLLLGLLHDDRYGERAGIELFAQPWTIGTATDAGPEHVALYGRGAVTLTEDPAGGGYDNLSVAGAQKLIVRDAA